MYIEATTEMKILEEIEVDLEKDNIHVILEGMIEAVLVDQDQVWDPVVIKIGLDGLNVGSMIILLETVQTQIQKKKKKTIRTNKTNV